MKKTNMKKRIALALVALLLIALGAASSLAEAVEPVGGAEAITPGGGQQTQQEAVKQFKLTLSQKEGVITAKITNASKREVDLTLLKDGKKVEGGAVIGNGSVRFSAQANGKYSVRAEYVTPAEGIKAVTKSITVKESEAKPSEPTQKTPTIKKLGAKVTTGAGYIEVKVTDADEWPLYIAVGSDVKTASLGESVRFSGLATGKYDIEADYVDPVSGVTPFRTSVSIKEAVKEISFVSLGGAGKISVSVTEASSLPVRIKVIQSNKTVAQKTLEKGKGDVEFTDLQAGTYTVSVNYNPTQKGISARKQTGVVVSKTMAKIKISKVTAGEGVLTVTGTAQPGADIALTTKPAMETAYVVRADKNGSYKAEIPLKAGTYTQVKAVYAADNAAAGATKKGTYVVKEPVVKPELTVDPVTDRMTVVKAKTDPGVKVKLEAKSYSYAKTATADKKGALSFTLHKKFVEGTKLTFTVYYGEDKSYTKTVTVTEDTAYILLNYGDTGDEVKKMTARLTELGYLTGSVNRFSSAVREAVRKFQENNNLTVDGMAGPDTLAKIYASDAAALGDQAESLKFGDKGTPVTKLQKRLKALGYYSIAVDGVYGSGTQTAVREFQRVNGLGKTGKADAATLKLIHSDSAKKADSKVEDYIKLTVSSTYNTAVLRLQRRLKELGYAVGTADGYYGSRTKNAVREFQKNNSLNASGVADSATQEALYADTAIKAPDESESAPADGYRLLTWGSKGSDVKRLQNALLAAGYKQVGKADGIYGQKTYDAVRAYQKDQGLAVDGIAGKDTQGALYGTND